VFFVGSAPGDISQQGQNVFGPAPASGILEPTGINGGAQMINQVTDRTSFFGHVNFLIRIQSKIFNCYKLFEIGHQSGVPFSGCLALYTGLAEVQTFGDALGDTSRFQTLIDPIHAVVTFDRFSGLRVPLGRSPRTGRNTRFASHAQFVVHKDDAVFGPFLHRARGTGRDAPRVLTMETGHKHVGHTRQVVDFFRADRNYLCQPRPDGQIVFRFAVRLAAETSNAAFGILVDVVFAHSTSSKLYNRLRSLAFPASAGFRVGLQHLILSLSDHIIVASKGWQQFWFLIDMMNSSHRLQLLNPEP
jgi:hypothetical protein